MPDPCRLILVVVLVVSCRLSPTTAAHADEAFAVADKLRLTGRYDEAIVESEKAANNNPIAAAIGIARSQRAVGKRDGARATLEKLSADQRDSAAASAELAQLAFERGDYAAARKHVDRALELEGNQLAARWFDAELERTAGRIEQADKAYAWLVEYQQHARQIVDPETFHWIGLALAQRARWHRRSEDFRLLISRIYPAARQANQNYWPAHVDAALLFLEKFNEPDAAAELDAALTINPYAAEIHAARAKLFLQKFDLENARISLRRALELNPNLAATHCCQADWLIANEQIAEALRAVQAARMLNPADEETLGRLAALYGAVDGLDNEAAGTRMGDVIDDAVKRNPHCGQFFFTLAETLENLRRYPQAARFYDEARRRLPQLLAPSGRIGLMYLRLGDEPRAATLLAESFRDDPFNVRVKNSLEVLDVLQGYAVVETEHFVLKFDRGQDELLAKYAAKYLEEEVFPQTIAAMSYAPPDKTLIEIFSRARNTDGHGWFSARMVGLPYIGTVGACAGKIIALTSPNDLPDKYNWARVLRHEFVHVVNLQQTDFQVPHWFTEALAVRREGLPRPPRWTEVLARRAAEGRLLNLATINLGFVRSASSDDWTLAYCQAQLYAEYLTATYGKDALTEMLAAYADHLDTAAALERCFGVGMDKFESGYAAFVRQVIRESLAPAAPARRNLAELQQAIVENPRDPESLAALAITYLEAGQDGRAERTALALARLSPPNQTAAYVQARLHLKAGRVDEATELLRDSLDEQVPDERVLTLLAGLQFRAGNFAEAERLYRLGERKLPHPDKWLQALAQLFLKSNERKKLAAVLQRLAELNPDNLLARKKLARMALDERDFSAAAFWAEQALQIDVLDAESHAWLAEAQCGRREFRLAIDEYETAIQLDPQQPVWRSALAETRVLADAEEKAR